MREWNESSIERHDLYNFESKIDYSINKDPKTKKSSYLLEAFFFIPENLQINKESYSKEQFFLDLNNRIRFKTPQMSFKGIISNSNKLSPINVILGKLKDLEYGKNEPDTEIRIEREIRLLACIVKVTLRDQFNYLFDNYHHLEKQIDINALLDIFLSSIIKLEKKLDCLREKFLFTRIPQKLREAFQFADEYISLQIKTWIAEALRQLEERLDDQNRSKMIKIIDKEQEFRKSIKSRVVLKENSSNEAFSYNESMLKKYVQGVLYLEKKKKDPKSSSLEILYSVAAGLAMFLSLFFGLLFLSNFAQNSLPFITVAVVIYMLKDRIKDNIRGMSQKAVGVYFPFKRVDIIDEFYQKTIGESKEKVNFLKDKDIPHEILNIRTSSHQSALEKEGKPEVVLQYKQKITLLNDEIEKIHKRKKDLSNILRFNIKEFLRYADDPIQYELLWNGTKRKVEEIAVAKVYHLNIVLKMTSYEGKKLKDTNFKKFRVILDQNGIKRIEEPEASL